MTEYLRSEKDRRDAIVSDKPDTKFYFESQKFSDIPEQQRPYVNSYSQIHAYGAQEVRNNKDLIEAAAARYSINPDIVKAIIYTEASRGALREACSMGARGRHALSREYQSELAGPHSGFGCQQSEGQH